MRELVGYYRYDTTTELTKLNEIRDLDAVFTNDLMPQQKLISEERVDAVSIRNMTRPRPRTSVGSTDIFTRALEAA
ncbi:hypothetical protein [Arthrobacter sp. H20]|uniref:hypothetical protein n=1 Tax=Arthrobacter sp. H20 TaxID=1267981 RepID=UPI000479989E|nr:hypothetical protein [Arthrobacter sp. H20]